MIETIKNLFKLTVFSIVAFAGILVFVHFASMKDDSVTLLWELPEMESIMAGVVIIVGLFALILVVKLALCVGPVIGGIFKVLLLPITLPFKVLGMFSRGGSSYSAPSNYSVPSSPKLTKYHFAISHIMTNGKAHSSIYRVGPFEAAHINDAKGMLEEKLVGSKYAQGNYVIRYANGGGKQYV